MTEGLSRLLDDCNILYLRAHSFHWSITGQMFQALHDLFEEKYKELAGAVDVIAERIRALGQPVSGTYADLVRFNSIKVVPGAPKADEIIRLQLECNKIVVRTVRAIIAGVEKVDGKASAVLLAQRIQQHEKTARMLRSML